MGLERGTHFWTRETAHGPSLIGSETRIVDSESRGEAAIVPLRSRPARIRARSLVVDQTAGNLTLAREVSAGRPP